MADPTDSSSGTDSGASSGASTEVSELVALVKLLLADRAAQAPASSAGASASSASASTAAPAAGVAVLTNGPASPAAGESAPASLLALFPEVEEALILSVIRHELRSVDLWKLDNRFRDRPDERVLALTTSGVGLAPNDSYSLRHYKSGHLSVSIPLETYFSILEEHAGTSGSAQLLTRGFRAYSAQLGNFVAEYEWPAVLAYHMAFHNKRRREMALGSVTGWGIIDQNLVTKHLVGRRRADTSSASTSGPSRKQSSPSGSSTGGSSICQNFNAGRCSDPCRFHRTHTCSTCGKADHGAHAHPATSST